MLVEAGTELFIDPRALNLGGRDGPLSRLARALSTGLLITVTTRSFVAAHAVTWKSACESNSPQVNMPTNFLSDEIH